MVDRPLYDLVLSVALRYNGEEKGRIFAEGYRDRPSSVFIFRLIPWHIPSLVSDD